MSVVQCPALCADLLDRGMVERTVTFRNANYYGTVNTNDVVEIVRVFNIPPVSWISFLEDRVIRR